MRPCSLTFSFMTARSVWGLLLQPRSTSFRAGEATLLRSGCRLRTCDRVFTPPWRRGVGTVGSESSGF